MSLENVFEAIFKNMCNENVDKAKSLLTQEQIDTLSEAIKRGNMDEIENLVFLKFRHIFEDLADSMGLCAEASFIVEHYAYVQESFRYMYEAYEGSACCSDKTRTVVNRLFNYHLKGKDIVFDPDEESTYHHPQKILNTHDKIVEFGAALRNLYYGSPGQYLTCIRKINEEGTQSL
jgi:hypothetical protein